SSSAGRRMAAASCFVTPARLASCCLLLLVVQLLRTSGSKVVVQEKKEPVGGMLTGTIMSLELPGSGGLTEQTSYYLTTTQHDAGDIIYRLAFCDGVLPEDIPMSAPVTVVYDEIIDGVVHSCTPPRESDDGQRQRRRALLGETITVPLEPRILVYITSFCGFPEPPVVSNPEEIMDLFFRTGDRRGRTLANYYNTCSYGQVTLLPKNVKVVGPVQIPCTGNLLTTRYFNSGSNFSSNSCNHDNLLKWQLWLDTFAAANQRLGINPSDYHHQVMLLPKSLSLKTEGCGGFSGLATRGPSSYEKTAINSWGRGLIWWSGDSVDRLEILLHEIGHTYGMAHGNIPGGCELRDQCDHTCTMGAYGGQGIRCLNAAHNWQIGWGRPFLELSNESLPYGKPTAPIRIPLQLSAKNSSVVVTGAGMPVNQRLFLSVRMNDYPYDLPYSFAGDTPHLLMHTYNGTVLSSYVATIHVGDLSVDSVWRDPDSDLVVRFDSWDKKTNAASVRICRRSSRQQEVNCKNGLDDDCDFLTDIEDPDCPKPPSPPIPPSPPSPPPLPSPPAPHPRLPPQPSPKPPSPKPPSPPRPSPRPPRPQPSPPSYPIRLQSPRPPPPKRPSPRPPRSPQAPRNPPSPRRQTPPPRAGAKP
ncbi:hypothetical protein Vretifemale_12896, partial [Volvox reticuliferus]